MRSPVFRAPRSTTQSPLPARLSMFARTAWHRMFLDLHAEFWLGELKPTWSLSEIRARVTAVIDETADTRTFVLAPNRWWPGNRAGQYVPVEVEIDGARVRRCYSISSGASQAGAASIAITVKRVPGGRVSNHLHDHVGVGTVLRLGKPAGEFVVDGAPDPAGAPRKLLLVAGGSGVTPIIAIVRELAAAEVVHDVVVVHCARTDADAIFASAFAELADAAPKIAIVPTRGTHLTPPELAAYVPDLATRDIYVCGPAGLVEVVTAVAAHHGVADRVRHERFVAAPIAPRAPAARATVRLALAAREVAIDGTGTLLEQLERAGERPAHGCRMGICNTCRCRKQTGTVLDLATGQTSSAPDEEIRLCTSIAQSDLALAL